LYRLANGIRKARGPAQRIKTQARLLAAALHPKSNINLSTMWISTLNA